MTYLLFNIQFSETSVLIANHVEDKIGRGCIYRILCKMMFFIFPTTVNANVKIAKKDAVLSDLKNELKQSLLPFREEEYVKNQQLVVLNKYYGKEIVVEDILYLKGRLFSGYNIILHAESIEKTHITALCLMSLVLNLYSVDDIVSIVRGIIPNFNVNTASLIKTQNIIDRTRNIKNPHSNLYRVKLGKN